MEHQPFAKKGKTLISSFFKKGNRQTSENNSIPTVTTLQHQYSETPSIFSFQNEYHSSPNLDLQSSSIEQDPGKKKRKYVNIMLMYEMR